MKNRRIKTNRKNREIKIITDRGLIAQEMCEDMGVSPYRARRLLDAVRETEKKELAND